MNRSIVYIGAKPNFEKNHAGGQSTAAQGLIEYSQDNDIALTIIDSAQESFPVPTLSQRIKKAAGRFVKLVNTLRKKKIDKVIIFCSGGFSFYEKSALALVSVIFGVETLLFVRSGHFMTECSHSRAKRILAGLLLKIPHEVGAQGQSWKKFYQQLGVPSKKIVVVRNWLASHRCVTQTPKTYCVSDDKKLTFVFVGWVVRNKGIYELLEAVGMSSVLKQCRFLVAGGGDALDDIKKKASNAGLDCIEFLGWQTPEQIDELLQEAHVFVLPSYAEGFPNALLEAISQGLPAVVTPVGSIPDSAIDGENSELVPVKDSDALRQALEKFYFTPALVEHYSKKSISLANCEHSREENCERLFNCSDKL